MEKRALYLKCAECYATSIIAPSCTRRNCLNCGSFRVKPMIVDERTRFYDEARNPQKASRKAPKFQMRACRKDLAAKQLRSA
jgi:hypothetical protein